MATFEEELAKQLGLVGYGVTQKRGTPSDATKKFYNYHEGTDYGTPPGTPIKPQFKGIYKGMINDQTGYGTRAVVYNPANNETYYLSHLSGVGNLQPGQEFEPGTPVAYTGGVPGTRGAGNTTGAHLDVVTKGGNDSSYNYASNLANTIASVAKSAASGSWRSNPQAAIQSVMKQYGNQAVAVSSNPEKLKQVAGKYKNARIVKVTV